jgi:hypothetical protein
MEIKDKSTYETPKMDALGTVETLTKGASSGSSLDSDFQSGTPRGDLTFS